MLYFCGLLTLVPMLATDAGNDWKVAAEHARQSQQAIQFCHRYAHGWLSHADPASGLLPRLVYQDAYYWDAHNCAADNYPFITLTAHVTDNYYLKSISLTILEKEQELTNRLDCLPDEYDFKTQAFRFPEYKLPALIFGASEYAKDGLMPVVEWIGPGPWLDRMQGLIRDIWKHAAVESSYGPLPSSNMEVNGELMQTMSRLYWLSGEEHYKTWVFRLADYYLLDNRVLTTKQLSLRDHGCEVVGGLSEAYLIAAREDAERHQKYREPMYALLDAILEHGRTEKGWLYNTFDPRSGEHDDKYSDGWGYVYNAFLTVAMVDDEQRYRQAVEHALAHIHQLDIGNNSADEYADYVEGVLNIMNRLPDESAGRWVDKNMGVIFSKQRPDGLLEGWYGDGNSARTAMMYALWKTQGIAPAPWRGDVQIGAVRSGENSVQVYLKSDWVWHGRLRFDPPRHKSYFNMPLDYPRINQFPEWFTVEQGKKYQIQINEAEPQLVTGEQLLSYPVSLAPNKPLHITVKPVP